MDPGTRYVVATHLYALCAVLGVGLGILFARRGEWFLVALCALFTAVALDNVFCGSRLRTAGCVVEGHYAFPRTRR